MGKMATRVMFLTDDAAPGSVWAAGNLTGGEREPGGIEGVDGVIDAPVAIAVPAAAAAATHGTECNLYFSCIAFIIPKTLMNSCPTY